eukprot:4798094-Pleurochrysis_carterae.AAC.1
MEGRATWRAACAIVAVRCDGALTRRACADEAYTELNVYWVQESCSRAVARGVSGARPKRAIAATAGGAQPSDAAADLMQRHTQAPTS